MRVVVVAEQLRRRVPGGIGTYVRGLAQGLGALGEDRPDVALTASRAPGRGADPLAELLPTETSPLPSWALVRAWDAGVAGPRRADAVHATSLAIPPTGGAPLSVMVHDLAWRHLPDAYPSHGRRWHEKGLRRAMARAAVLMTPSAETADDLVSAGAVASRVQVVEEGADHLPAPDHDAAQELLQRLGVPGRYVLTVSTLEPRKNLDRLVAAFASARATLADPYHLVVVGPAGWGDAGIGPAASDPGPSGREREAGSGVVLTGHVTDAVLSSLYAGARLMAYVPLKEGFGLPVIEAMNAGTPVVASAVPSAGRAARQVDATDVESIAEGLVEVATDDRIRAHLVDEGRRRAAALTWAGAAARHVELWRDMHEGRRRRP